MKTISLTFSFEQLVTIDKALRLAPYGEVAPLIAHINSQLQVKHDERRDEDMPNGTREIPEDLKK